MRSDRAALGVAELCNIAESEGCDMHDGDKVSCSGTGRLVRSRQKIAVNPFIKGKNILLLAQELAVCWNHGDRIDTLKLIAKKHGQDDWPAIRPEMAHNGTRIAAQHSLLYSLIRMSQSIQVSQSPLEKETMLSLSKGKNSKQCPRISDENWVAFHQIEAILNTTQLLTKLSQTENLFMGAYGPIIKHRVYNIIKHRVYNALKGKVIKSIDLDKSLLKPSRVDLHFEDCCDIAQQVWLRCIVEFERRFLCNDSDFPYSDPDWDSEYKKLSFPTNVEIKYPTETLNDTKFIHASKRETMAIFF